MTSPKQNSNLDVQVIAAWLGEKGFKEAAAHLLEASDEVAQLVYEAGYVDWLDRMHELKEARRTSGNDDDLPWE